MFVTALHGVLDARAKTFTYARAGLNPPVLFQPGLGPSLLNSRGTALGVMGTDRLGAKLEEMIVPLAEGSTCLLYTDGLTEAMAPAGEEFGMQRLLDAVAASGEADTAKTFLSGIISVLGRFVQTAALNDDLTLVAIRKRPE